MKISHVRYTVSLSESLTGAALLATVVGVILAVLSQRGYIGAPKPAPSLIVITPVELAALIARAVAPAQLKQVTQA